MKEPTNRFYEINTENLDFQAQIDAITSSVLSPENIETYADDALNNLISVISHVLDEYDGIVHPFIGESKEKEEAALACFGINRKEIDDTLKRIVSVAIEVDALNDLIKSVRRTGETLPNEFVPADSGTTLQNGNGNYVAPKVIQRLKTLLFVLKENFSLDLSPDAGEVVITPGAVKSSAMRKLPYDVVEIPSLNRMILVCDEEGNKTFVFDAKVLGDNDQTVPNVAHMKKPQLLELIKTYPGIGTDIAYSERFTANMISLLITIPEEEQAAEQDKGAGKYLRHQFELAPAENRTLKGIQNDTGLDSKLLKRALENVRDSVGTIKRYLHGPRDFDSFDPSQQAIIVDKAHRLRPDMEKQSDDRHTVNQMATRLKIASDVIRQVVKETNEESIEQRVNNRPSPTFDEAAFDRIKINPRVQKVLQTPRIPDDVQTNSELSDEWGVAPKTILQTAREYHMPIGDYKVGQRDKIAVGYLPEDKEYIRLILEKKGNFAPKIAEDEYSVVMAKDILRMSEHTIRKVIAILEKDPTFGVLKIRKVNSLPTKVMSETQLQKVDEYMTSHDMRRTPA